MVILGGARFTIHNTIGRSPNPLFLQLPGSTTPINSRYEKDIFTDDRRFRVCSDGNGLHVARGKRSCGAG